MNRSVSLCRVLLLAVALAGCKPPAVTFPRAPLPSTPDGTTATYDTTGDGRGDFFLLADAEGRIDRLGYDYAGAVAGEGPDEIVNMDAIPSVRCRHLMIIVDGFLFDLIRDEYEAGRLRVFHPPSLVIAPYPAMTDLAMEDFLGYMPCRAYEAKYFDRDENRVIGGSEAYLEGRNEPYNRILDYRADLIWVPIFYLWPRAVFEKEIHDCKRAFDRGEKQEMLAYFGSTAGMGTRFSREGQRECLRELERLILQVLRESRGLTEITFMSDHGHTYTAPEVIDFEAELGKSGWRLHDGLDEPRDVVLIEFGVTTYAGFYANERADLARDLVDVDGVELASYAKGESVVVLAPEEDEGKPARHAVIRQRDGRFRYEPVRGDPLALTPILAELTPDEAGYYDADDLLRATARHHWPAPLQRLWRAHLGIVENPPDVVASLADDRCVGSEMFRSAIETASTHGGLNYRNSAAFIMSTAGPLPPVMRARDVPEALRALLSVEIWPTGE